MKKLLLVLVKGQEISALEDLTGVKIERVQLNEGNQFTNLVIFIKFADEDDYTAPYSDQYYEELFNGLNTESVRDYFLEASYGQMTIDSELVDDGTQIVYYQDMYPRGYYEPYDPIENPIGYDNTTLIPDFIREHELLKRANNFVDDSNLVDPTIDLDMNDDGLIDSITFMVSGEDSGWGTLLWPHKWSLVYYNNGNDVFRTDAPKIGDVYAYDYTFELLGNTTEYEVQTCVYILAHELFHLISAPDLYHYYGFGYLEAIGNWGLMASRGTIPPHMLGYMKETYGNWISDVETVTGAGTYTLAPMQDAATNLLRIYTGVDNEYIYVEYRDQQGRYESNTPGSGLIAYRVDMDVRGLGNVYGYEDPFGFGDVLEEVFLFRPGINDIEEPIEFPVDTDNVDYDGYTDLAAISQHNTYFEMNTTTEFMMFGVNGYRYDITITNVVEGNGTITFDITMDDVELPDDPVDPVDTTDHYATLIHDATTMFPEYTKVAYTPELVLTFEVSNPHNYAVRYNYDFDDVPEM